MLFSSNETSATYDKPFASAEYTTNTSLRPCVSVTYSDYIAVSQICMESGTRELSVNDTAQLTATVVPSNATNKNIVWTSSNNSIATVGATGLVCAHKPGTVTITATSAADNSKFAVCTVKVLNEAIIIVPGIMGTELELSAPARGLSTGTLVWPPYEVGENVGPEAINKLAALQCDTNGDSVYSLRIRNDDNYGALDEYKILYTELANTYGSSREVVFFGYDWRKSNVVSGNNLRLKVNEYDRVIIVAHSMGGLVTSHMLTNINIRSKVEKIITLGTPYLGSLEMVPVLSHGDLGMIDSVLPEDWPAPLKFVAKEAILKPTLRTIAANIPSLYELLPTKKFFSLDNRYYYSINYLLGGNTPITTYDLTRTNLSIAIADYNVDLFDAATAMHDSLWNGNNHVTACVNQYYIIGEDHSTMRTYTFNHFSGSYSSTSVFHGGDGTVLSYSASMNDLYSSKTYYVDAGHNELIKFKGLNSTPNVIGFTKNLINGSTVLTDGMRSTPDWTFV